ncbi:Uncharacterized protein OBRU01_24189 [Operophtera brumata]|uniref:Uncharacterized protein n=1 Tax=Operophtera brumata TaxID=104452 RepID=A0A0L7KMY4_OPEBR|nr:Uncharacterized protein OBRU01_24189 [Operophtera brumata]
MAVTPESIVVPIVSCIFGFPLLALTVICCLRRRAKLARERARRRNCELDRGELSVVRLSPMKHKQRAVSLVRCPRPPPTLELDTVLEERSDPEQTTTSQVPRLLTMPYNKHRAVSLVRCPRPPPTLELDTVLEERSDPEQTTTSQLGARSPLWAALTSQPLDADVDEADEDTLDDS